MPPIALQLDPATVLAPPSTRPEKPLHSGLYSPATQKSIDGALRSIFPESKEETKLQRARSILKDIARDIPDEELNVFITELQFLIDSWLDSYEQQVFNGLTLRQVLQGG